MTQCLFRRGHRLRCVPVGMRGHGRQPEKTRNPVRHGSPARMLLAVAAGWFLVLGMRFVVPAVLPRRTASVIRTQRPDSRSRALARDTRQCRFRRGADRSESPLSPLSLSALLSGVGSGCFFAPVFSLFLIATGAFGLGTGLYGPTRGTALSRTFDAREGTAVGVVMAVGSLGRRYDPTTPVSQTAPVGKLSAAPLAFFHQYTSETHECRTVQPASPNGASGRTSERFSRLSPDGSCCRFSGKL